MTSFTERYFGGAVELEVCDASKTFTLFYKPEIWHKIPVEKQIKYRDAMIRVTDYWWSKGYKEQLCPTPT